MYESQATALQIIKEIGDDEKIKALKNDVKGWCQEAITIANVEERTSPFFQLKEIMKTAAASLWNLRQLGIRQTAILKRQPDNLKNIDFLPTQIMPIPISANFLFVKVDFLR